VVLDLDDPVRVRIREGLQQDGVDKREDRQHRSHPDPQRQHRDPREARHPEKRPRRQAKLPDHTHHLLSHADLDSQPHAVQ
jgi:hypothetical protein